MFGWKQDEFKFLLESPSKLCIFNAMFDLIRAEKKYFCWVSGTFDTLTLLQFLLNLGFIGFKKTERYDFIFETSLNTDQTNLNLNARQPFHETILQFIRLLIFCTHLFRSSWIQLYPSRHWVTALQSHGEKQPLTFTSRGNLEFPIGLTARTQAETKRKKSRKRSQF